MSGKKPKRRDVAKRQDAGTVEQHHVHVKGQASEVTVARFHLGSLPSAEEAAAYKGIQPGAFDRLLSMVEHQAEHRRAREARKVDADICVDRETSEKADPASVGMDCRTPRRHWASGQELATDMTSSFGSPDGLRRGIDTSFSAQDDLTYTLRQRAV